MAWCPSDIGQVVTCGDDSVVKVWRLNRAEEGPRLQQQQSQRVRRTVRPRYWPPDSPKSLRSEGKEGGRTHFQSWPG